MADHTQIHSFINQDKQYILIKPTFSSYSIGHLNPQMQTLESVLSRCIPCHVPIHTFCTSTDSSKIWNGTSERRSFAIKHQRGDQSYQFNPSQKTINSQVAEWCTLPIPCFEWTLYMHKSGTNRTPNRSGDSELCPERKEWITVNTNSTQDGFFQIILSMDTWSMTAATMESPSDPPVGGPNGRLSAINKYCMFTT